MTDNPAYIGRYKVVERIGQGGMGSLFLAHDPIIDRLVAVKVLREGLDNPALRERFRREARAAGRLRHPNIVTIFDVGDHEDQPFIAMEYLPGETIAELIRRRAPLSLSRKLALVEGICDGLAYAHKSGIVHRDIKPANLMVDPEGGVKILDFGIVRIAESGMTQAGMVVGTLNYMSPEQIAGSPVDLRSDIFAVGAVAYELLMYQQAFPGTLSDGILYRLMNSPPAPLDSAKFGADICAIVTKALEKNPNQRYRDLALMRKDLERARRKLPGEEDAEHAPPQDMETQVLRVPTGHGVVTRRSTGAESRRAALIESHLKDAREALEAGDYQKALNAGEEVIVMDPGHAAALEIIDRAHAALTEQQYRDHLKQAREALAGGRFDAADQAFNQAAAAMAELKHPADLEAELQALRTEIAQGRERHGLVQAALLRARTSVESEAYESAIRATSEVLALDNTNADALEIRAAARSALDRRAEEAIAEADRQFAAGDHAGAVERLKSAASHEKIAAAIERLQRRQEDLAADEARAHAEREKVLEALNTLQVQADKQIAAGDLRAARASLARMQEMAPREPDVAALGAKITARERAYADRKTQAAAALQRKDFDAVHAALAEARAIGGEDAEFTALASRLRDAEAAAAREAASQAAFEVERSRAASALDAGDLAAAAAAIAAADRVIRKHPSLAELQRRLDAAQAQERKRADQIKQKLKDAGRLVRKRDGAAALAAIQAVLDLDPQNAEALRLREEAKDAERTAEAERLAREASQAAARQPVPARDDANQQQRVVTPAKSRMPLFAAAGGLVLLLVVIAAWALQDRPAPDPPQTETAQNGATTPATVPPSTTVPAATPEITGKSPDPPPAPDTPDPATRESAPPPAADNSSAIESLLARARQQIRRGQRAEALESLRQAEKLDPNHAQIRGAYAPLVQAALGSVASSRTKADRNPAAAGTPSYSSAVERQRLGEQLVKKGQTAAALPMLWQAADEFDAAAATPPPAQPSAPEPEPKPVPVDPKPKEEPPPSPPAGTTPPPPAAPKPVDENAAVRAALMAYQNAWSGMDVGAMGRVFPLTPDQTKSIRKMFDDHNSITWELNVQNVRVTGPDRATASARVVQVLDPKGGGGKTTRTLTGTYLLEKRGGTWIIVSASHR